MGHRLRVRVTTTVDADLFKRAREAKMVLSKALDSAILNALESKPSEAPKPVEVSKYEPWTPTEPRKWAKIEAKLCGICLAKHDCPCERAKAAYNALA